MFRFFATDRSIPLEMQLSKDYLLIRWAFGIRH